MTYQKLKFSPETGEPKTVKRIEDDSFIPFDLSNSDYKQFKIDVSEGVELLDYEGTVMTKTQVDEFLQTIP